MKGQVVVVTGASQGIGMHLCRRLARAGYRVHGMVRNLDQCTPFDGVMLHHLDVTDRETIDAAIAEVMEAEGRIDVLVNSAGHGLFGAVEMAGEEEMRHQFDVNLFGLIRVCQAVLPHMRAAGGGRIVNISSVVGVYSSPGAGLYSATKHALEAVTASMAYEVKQWNVQVVNVNPGWVRTAFVANMAGVQRGCEEDPYAEFHQHVQRGFKEGIAGGQDPEEVAGVIQEVIESPNPPLRTPTSEIGREIMESQVADLSGAAWMASVAGD